MYSIVYVGLWYIILRKSMYKINMLCLYKNNNNNIFNIRSKIYALSVFHMRLELGLLTCIFQTLDY